MPGTLNGIGTQYIGASDRQADGSFVTTEWFVFFVPLIPLRSCRVQYLGEQSSSGKTTNLYNVIEQLSLDTKQVFRIYGVLGGLTLAVALLSLFFLEAGERGASLCIGPAFAMALWILVGTNLLFKAK